MYYLVADVFPAIHSASFQQYAGATVGCWIREDLVVGPQGLRALAERELAAGGWVLAKVISHELVSRMTYVRRIREREYLEQARVDGFVASVHRNRRDRISLDNAVNDMDVAQGFLRFCEAVREAGAVSFRSRKDGRWARCALPSGDEVFPLWSGRGDLAAWRNRWPDHEIQAIRHASELLSVMKEADEAKAWAGLGLQDFEIVTFHPLEVIRRFGGQFACEAE